MSVVMAKILHVTNAKHLTGYRIDVSFNDGRHGTVDLEPWLQGPIFEPLRDPEQFISFRLEGHTLAWPNGADFAPEFLHAIAASPHG